jgi:hypothetical protein
MIGQNCFGRWSPTILTVRSRSRIPSPPANSTAQKCRGMGGVGAEMFVNVIIPAPRIGHLVDAPLRAT